MSLPIPTWRHSCDCGCPVHKGAVRDTYDDPGCACTLICPTQPVTLLAGPWGCALFLDQDGVLWFVNNLAGVWDWSTAAQVDPRDDHYQASVLIEHLLRLIQHILAVDPD